MRASSRVIAVILVAVLVGPLAEPAAGQQPSESAAPPSDVTMAPMPPTPPDSTASSTPPDSTAPSTPPDATAPPTPPDSTASSTPLDSTAQTSPPSVPAAADTQAAQTPPPPPAGTPPPPPPGPTRVQPDLFQETVKAGRVGEEYQGAYNAEAAVVNVFLVPGRTITCAVGGVVGVGVLLLTLGTAYRAAAATWREGCGGKWMVTGDDLRPSAYTYTSDAYDWGRP